MNNFTYENQGTETMLVYHLEAEEHLDGFARGMLQGNEMEGILRPSFIQRDMDQYLKYPVTSKLPLKEFLSGEMERETVLRLCLSVAGTVRELEEYMLSPEKLVLDEDYIFVDVRKKKASLVYFPIDEFLQEITVKEFLRSLLSHMQFRMDQDVSYVARLLHFLNQPKPWKYGELKRYIENLIVEKGDNGILNSAQSFEKGVGREAAGFTMPMKPVSAEGQKRSPSDMLPGQMTPPVLPADQMLQPPGMSPDRVSQPPVMEPGQILQYENPEKRKAGIFGKKDRKDKQDKKETKQEKNKRGLFGRKSGQDGAGIPEPPAVSGAPAIPDVPAVSGAPAIPGVPPVSGAPSVAGISSASGTSPVPGTPPPQTDKKGLFGHRKKKEPKPFIAPLPSVKPMEVPVPPIPGQMAGSGVPPVPGAAPASGIPPASGISPVSGIPSASGIPPASGISPVSGIPPAPGMPPAPEQRVFGSVPYAQPPAEASRPAADTVYMGQGSSDEDNRTVIMGGGEDYGSTVLLGGAAAGSSGRVNHVVKITRRRTGQSMIINQDSLRIGSEGSFVDFYIADNPAIGGCHADITRTGGIWYITDRNSANHTCVNGAMIPPMQAVQLNNGAVITLADEDFDFIIS